MSSKLRLVKKLISGLQFRTTVILTTVVLAATGLTGALYLRATTSIILEQSKSRARDLAQSLALASARDVAEDDGESLLRVSQGIIPGSEICYIIFTDATGGVIASFQQGQGNITRFLLDEANRVSVQPIDEPTVHVNRDNGARVDVVFPVRSIDPLHEDSGPAPTVGYVRLGVSLTKAEEHLATLAHDAVSLVILITLLMVPLGYQIVHNVVSPVHKLRDAAHSISRSELDVRVTLKRNDEIGELAESFNAMADRIEATHGKLLQLNSELEDRVLKRTHALESANVRLREMAARDSLTGLYNRRHLNDLIGQLFAESTRYGTNLTCVMIDLDNLKHVNDSLGHRAGDDLIRLASNVIQRSIREADIGVRYGGDEFLVLMPQTGPDEARASAERILATFREDIERDMPSAAIASLSIGLASRQDKEPRTAEALIELADEALYLAKAGGKNRITVVQPIPEPYRGDGI